MKKSKLNLGLFFCFMLVLSCSIERKDNRLMLVENAWEKLEERNDLTDKKALLIIPDAGCSGCITSAENFAIMAVETMPSLVIIFTGTSSQKQLRLKIGVEVYNSVNVKIDTDDYFYEGDLFSVYPLVVYLDNGSPIKIIEQSPFNENALDSLQAYLLSPPIK